MGCFFGCFRVKDPNANLVTSSEPVVPRSKNALSSLFLCDDETLRKGKEVRNQLPGQLGARDLKDEAKILKASGILPEISAEIRKSSRSNSWLPPTSSIEELKLGKQSVESPLSAKICEELFTGSRSTLNSPSSCMTDGRNTERASSSLIRRSDVQNVVTPTGTCDSETRSEILSVSTQTFASSVQCKNKSVYFQYASDSSVFSSKDFSSECVSSHSKQSGSAGISSMTKSLPYPTPIRLTEEMQTPGTVFPTCREDTTIAQVSETTSQYVNSVPDRAEYPSQWNELEGGNSNSNHPNESLKLKYEDNLISTPLSDLSVRKDMDGEASLTSWFKPISANQDHNNKRFSSVSSENIHWRKTPVDRPILGMMAAHWNDDGTSHTSPKWWDGNGIPNSTNKYKEDQKVSWHATPFEERLEKALSEETLITQRKPMNRTPPFELNETEESDTALSHLQSSAHLKSVVSF